MQAINSKDLYLIETSDLASSLANHKIVNCTWYLPNMKRNAWQEHLTGRITKETTFFDVDEVCLKNGLPHTMPTVEIFTDNMKKLGIEKNDSVVCYDNLGMFSVARVAWMMRYFGMQNVKILNGGLKKWQMEEREVVGGEQPHPKDIEVPQVEGNFDFTKPTPDTCILDIAEIHQIALKLMQGEECPQVLDARGGDRFLGKVPEARAGVRSGNITNSINVPFNTLVNPEDGSMRSKEELVKIFADKGISLDKPIVNTCGSGVTACVVDLGLKLAGFQNPENSQIYDGSWAEYGSVEEPEYLTKLKK